MNADMLGQLPEGDTWFPGQISSCIQGNVGTLMHLPLPPNGSLNSSDGATPKNDANDANIKKTLH